MTETVELAAGASLPDADQFVLVTCREDGNFRVETWTGPPYHLTVVCEGSGPYSVAIQQAQQAASKGGFATIYVRRHLAGAS